MNHKEEPLENTYGKKPRKSMHGSWWQIKLFKCTGKY